MAKILIVDDSVSMRQMVTFTLEGVGHEVDQAEDGIEALAKAKAKQYEMVLTDVNMPNLDGIEMTRQMRQLEGYQFLPILMLTTEAADDKKMAGRDAGATGWIVKPFSPDKLLATVNKLLG
ncbi:MAG: response regulator [Gammaproteobacteria bacterium]|jgi:two-component system, chemotaxis family, chemotaxis protein CheY|nr:response regulator [Gammaproteobacteria bacterium]